MNCTFVHPDLSLLKEACRSRFCPRVVARRDFDCKLGAACPFVLKPEMLRPPHSLERASAVESDQDHVTLEGQRVPMRYVMRTQGLTSWLSLSSNERRASSTSIHPALHTSGRLWLLTPHACEQPARYARTSAVTSGSCA
jgi:hypothetical protein